MKIKFLFLLIFLFASGGWLKAASPQKESKDPAKGKQQLLQILDLREGRYEARPDKSQTIDKSNSNDSRFCQNEELEVFVNVDATASLTLVVGVELSFPKLELSTYHERESTICQNQFTNTIKPKSLQQKLTRLCGQSKIVTINNFEFAKDEILYTRDQDHHKQSCHYRWLRPLTRPGIPQ